MAAVNGRQGSWTQRLWLLGAVVGVALAACSDGSSSESLGQASQALTLAQQRILGFESVGAPSTDWTTSSGTLSQSTRHVEGAKSLAIANGGNAEITSAALSSLGPIADKVTLDLLLPAAQPNPNWMGTLKLVISCPSQQLSYEGLAEYQLQGKPTEQFLRFEFPLSASTRQKLSTGTYSDLRFKILLNVATGAGPWLLDRLSVGDSGSGGGGAGGSGGGSGAGGTGGASGTAGTSGSAGSSGASARDVTFRIVTPKGVLPGDVAVGATNSLRLNDGVSLVRANGSGNTSASSAGNPGSSYLGVHASLLNLSSIGPVELRNDATVWGNLTTSGATTFLPGASVQGTQVEGVSLLPRNVLSWKVSFPLPNAGPVPLEPNTTRILDPGNYGSLAVKSGAHLKLRRGTYRFEDGAIETNASLDIDNTAGPVFIYFRLGLLWNGITNPQTTADNVLFGVGALSNQLGSPWKQFLVANGTASLISAQGIGHEGSVFADDVILHQSTPFRHHPFVPGNFCDPQNPMECGPFCPCDTGGACDSTLECRSGLSCQVGTCRDCANGGCEGSSCSTSSSCVPGLVCAAGECRAVCDAHPDAFGCIAPHCANGVKDGSESDVDCGGDCPACDPGGICNGNSDCGNGKVCGTNNGAHFGRARADDVCWDPSCNSDSSDCGQANSKCGPHCPGATPCDPSDPAASCPAGEVCKRGLAPLFDLGMEVTGVCADPSCPSNDPTKCGEQDSLCGKQCICTPDCSHATAADPSDGCGGQCPNVCALGQACCTQDVHCPTGAACVAQPSGPGICRNTSCLFKHLEPPLCGHSGAVCGDTCPACTPACDGRQCGTDPACGVSCGTCAAGTFCNGSGQCAAGTSDAPLTVPNGSGGTTELPPLPPGPTSAVGALAGQFSVSEQGTALYSVPIEVPPGRAGMQPALSLAYVGPRVDGSVGSGWKLEGLSQITRCPKVYALDGYSAPIKNDPTDSFCIDGKRLELVGGAAVYGENGAEYRTLIDTFTKVVSYVEAGTRVQDVAWPNVPQAQPSAQGPDWFQVWTKDGRILTYGKTRDALILGRNGARASWLLQRVEDRAGNSMVMRYRNQRIEMPAQLPQLPAVIVTPEAIFYGGNGASDGDHVVLFEYDARTDAVTRFAQGGVPMVASVRLKGITTSVQGRVVKNYRVKYESEVNSLVQSISECAGREDTSPCKPPTEFDYVADVGFESRLSALRVNSGAQFDVNGDGIPDFLSTQAQVDGVSAQPFATAAFVAADIAVGVGSMYVPPPGIGALAVNGLWALGKVVLFDALAPEPKVTYSTDIEIGSSARGGVFQSVTASGRPCPYGPAYFLDYDQDGKDEVAAMCGSAFAPTRSLVATRSLGDGNFAPFPIADVEFAATYSTPRALLFDVNGDALQDLVSCATSSKLEVRLRKSPSEGFAPVPLEFRGRVAADLQGNIFRERIPFCGDALPSFSLNDLDGDGTPELIAFYSPTEDERKFFPAGALGGALFGAYRAQGTYALRLTLAGTLDWQPVSAPHESLAGSSAGALSGDFNGDGLIDFWNGYGDSSHLWLNTGAGFLLQTFNHPRPALGVISTSRFHRAGVLDYDGDGKLDLLEEWTQNDSQPNTDVLLQPFRPPFPSARLFTEITVPTSSGGTRPAPIEMVRDVDGDGSADVIGGGSIFYGKGVRNGLLSKVTDGLGNEVRIDYADAYKGTCSEAQQWPERCLKKMQGLVSGYTTGFNYKTADGIGQFSDERRYSYSYENARLSMTGHGWLGFDKVTVKEQTSGAGAQVTTSTTEYTPATRYTPAGAATTSTAPPYLYPLAGLARVVTIDQTGSDQGIETLEDGAHSRRTRRTNFWSVAQSADGRPFPILEGANIVTFSRPYSGSDGAPIAPGDDGHTRTRCYEVNKEFDGYGNAHITSRGCTGPEIVEDLSPRILEFTSTEVDSFIKNRSAWLISHPIGAHIESYRYPAAVGASEVQDYSYSYDSLGQFASVIRDPEGEHEETVYHHDDHGNVDSITRRAPGELDRTTSIIYDDGKLFPVLVTNPEGHQTQVSFSADFGQLQGLVDPNGVSVQHSYDRFGRRTLSADASGSTVYTFAAQPDTVLKTPAGYVYPRAVVTVEQRGTANSFGGRSEQILDNHGRVVRTTTVGFAGKEVTTDRAFDPRGRVIATTAPRTATDAPAVTEYEYDFLDRPVRTTLPDGATSEHRYGSAVHLASQYQPSLTGFACHGAFNGVVGFPPEFCAVDVELMTEPHKPGETVRQNIVLRDFDGLVVRTVDGENVSSATPKTSDFDYQPFGRLTKLRANDGTVTTLQHDPYGRLTYQFDADSLGRIYTYNPFSELKTSFEGNSNLRTFNYDRLGRVVSALDDAGTTQWIYDQGPSALGQLSESISPPTTENAAGQHVLYGYEPATSTSRRALLKSLTYVIDGVSYAIGLHYDDLARAQQVDYPDLGSGTPIKAQYGYDDLSGALTSLSEVGGNSTRFIWGISDAFQGQLPSSIQFGNGASSTISYDPQRHFLDTIETKLNGATIQSLGYQRYGNGQVQELLNTQGSQADHTVYEYDLVGRLAQTTQTSPGHPDVIQGYGYDIHGNLNNFAGKTITFPAATPHLPSAVGSATYTPDLNGNLASRTGPDVPGGSQVFTYTPFDLPSTITTGTTNPRVTHLDYTADEQRVVRRDPDRTHHFAGDLYERISSPSGATLEEHFRLPAGGTMVAEIIRTPAGDQTLYFHPDALGTPETLTDAAGTVTHQTFAPFGTRPDSAPGPATRIGYTGQHQDDDLALIDMGGRIYDPLAGRFTTADPILQAPYWSQGQNRYAYVFNDPINATDPSGFSAVDGRDVYDTTAGFATVAYIPGAAALSTMSVSSWGAAGGSVGGIGNVVGTLLANPFGSSSGGTYGAPAPSGAPSSNPVKPGGMNAFGQGSPPGPVQRAAGPKNAGGKGVDPLAERSRFAGAQYSIARELANGQPDAAVKIAARFWDARVPVDYAKELEIAGETRLYSNGNVTVIIGPTGAQDASGLMSTTGHEVGVHVRQARLGNWAPSSNNIANAVNEIEGYDFEIANAGRTGISANELGQLRQFRSEFYDVIRGTPYQARVNAGNYQLFSKDVVQ